MKGHQHRVIGTAVGASFVVGKHLINKKENPNAKFPWQDLFLFSAIGFLCASLPDILEPASNPNHRKIFHSLVTAGAIGYGAFGKHIEKLDQPSKRVLQALALSYLSHLGADATTVKSLPILHPKIA